MLKVLVTNIDGGHFDLTFWRSRTQSTAVVEQKISAYIKYVNMHDYLLVLKNAVRLITEGLLRKSV